MANNNSQNKSIINRSYTKNANIEHISFEPDVENVITVDHQGNIKIKEEEINNR